MTASYNNPSSFLDGLGFNPDWPCCEAMKVALPTDDVRIIRFAIFFLSVSAIEIKFCPWCGTDIALIRHKISFGLASLP